MSDLLDGSSGVWLDQDEYEDDLARREEAVEGHDSWKLERRQYFQEPGDPSWEAFARGDWETSLQVTEAERNRLAQLRRTAEERRCALWRVRVVENPIVPYLQWELRWLRLQEDYGERIHVVGPEHVRDLEARGRLPELLTIGADTVYEIVYDGNGRPDGAVRYADPALTTRVVQFVKRLYDVGEELKDFFEREVAHLATPPPRELANERRFSGDVDGPTRGKRTGQGRRTDVLGVLRTR